MISVLSPARNVQPAGFPGVSVTQPRFLGEANLLAAELRRFAPWQLESLLDLSAERALALFEAYRRFDAEMAGTPALLSFQGAAFQNLGPSGFSAEEFEFANGHLRILSALYGLLRPSDGVLVHRLGLQGLSHEGVDLYAFWGNKVYGELFGDSKVVIGLCSDEYARLFKPFLSPEDRYIACRFLLQKPDGIRGTVSTVRAARGQMARFIVQERIDAPEGLRDFAWNGYRFTPGRSTPSSLVFIKDVRGTA